jgi:hypothetical protein
MRFKLDHGLEDGVYHFVICLEKSGEIAIYPWLLWKEATRKAASLRHKRGGRVIVKIVSSEDFLEWFDGLSS